MAVIYAFTSMLCTVACTNEDYEDFPLEETEYVATGVNDTYIADNLNTVSDIEAWNEKIAKLGWEKQLGLIMENQTKNVGNMELILKGYSYKGVIGKQEIKDFILTPDNLLPVYDSINSFELLPISRLEENGVKWREEQNNYLDSICNTEVETVILNWDYKGNTFSTMALVSNQKRGIIYDNIASNIKITETIDIAKTVISDMTPRLKSGTEENKNIKSEISKGQRIISFWGGLEASAVSTMTVTGTIVNGQKYVSNYSKHSEIYTDPNYGYSADSKMEVKKLERGISGYVDFIYAYYIAYKTQCTITGGIVVGGFNVSVSGQSSGGSVIEDSGSHIIYANDLN